jgi:hypothetical protein
MKIEIYHQYSKLDNEHQFGIEIIDKDNYYETYINWVWFYLGVYLGKDKLTIYPHRPLWSKKPKVYKYLDNAERQAKLIADYIKSKL